MMRLMLLCGATLAFACMPATALADWFDDFDSYANDSSLHGQGGWKGWDNDPAWTAYVRDDQALSLPHSAEIALDSDLIHEYDGYTSGHWTYTAWQYIPSDMEGESYFIMQNTYNDGGPYNWSVQLDFMSATGMLVGDCGAADNVTMPYIVDEWVEIRVEIFLDPDDDWTQVHYNGVLLDSAALPDHPVLGGGYCWSAGVFGQGGGVLDIGAVDLFANGATPVYYDSMSLVPEPAACVLLALGAVIGLRRR